MCWECGETLPLGEPCRGCGEPVTILDIDPASGKRCAHRLVPATFTALRDGRFRATAFDGADVHRCLTDAERRQIAAMLESGWPEQPAVDLHDGRVHFELTEGEESWVRTTDEPDIRSLEVMRLEAHGGWQVGVAVMEFVRSGDAPYAELVRAIETAIGSVDGVESVVREDTEVWWIEGSFSGEQVAIAVATVLDERADVLRAHYENLT
jgi:hypothetical protein